MCFFVCLTVSCFWKQNILNRAVNTEVRSFYAWIWHTFPFAKAFTMGIWVNLLRNLARFKAPNCSGHCCCITGFRFLWQYLVFKVSTGWPEVSLEHLPTLSLQPSLCTALRAHVFPCSPLSLSQKCSSVTCYWTFVSPVMGKSGREGLSFRFWVNLALLRALCPRLGDLASSVLLACSQHLFLPLPQG